MLILLEDPLPAFEKTLDKLTLKLLNNNSQVRILAEIMQHTFHGQYAETD